MKDDALYFSDRGDGSYQNPVLFCDYSDPDAIRVGDTYYLTASSFNYVPGLPILTSRDLVNWELRGYALSNIPEARYAVPRHAQGVWAPAMRWHDGWFYIYYGMPDEGIYMVRARDALGEWEPPVLVLAGKGLIDPCPFWDEDGRAYVVHGYARTRIGFKSVLGIFPMSADGSRTVGDDHILYDARKKHPTMEGPKAYRRGEYVYIFAPAGGVATGWQVVLRAKDILGPYEDRVVLKQGSSPINGPHQGAWVTTPGGEDWFLHFQSRGLYGRITHLQPMAWGEDGWPRMGEPDAHPVDPASIPAGEGAAEAALAANAADCGIPVLTHKKPEGPSCPRLSLQASDDFAGGRLGLQWQFMGNWRPDFYTLTERPGRLRLYARALPEGGVNLWHCPQALTQKIVGLAWTADVSLDASGLREGARAGLALVGGQYAYAALCKERDGYRLVFAVSMGEDKGETVEESRAWPSSCAALRVRLTPTGYAEVSCTFEVSADGERFESVGRPFSPGRHMWVGGRLTLFALPRAGGPDGGFADYGAFTVKPEG